MDPNPCCLTGPSPTHYKTYHSPKAAVVDAVAMKKTTAVDNDTPLLEAVAGELLY